MSQSNLTDEQIARFKQMLLDEKTRIEIERADYRGEEAGDTEEQEGGDLADYDPNDPADEASNLFDRDRMMAATENMTRILDKIERALKKIDDGTYGFSDIDGKPIPIERLEAIPYAVTTVQQEESV
jgi:RNA polymerase-binding transcription factor DksA